MSLHTHHIIFIGLAWPKPVICLSSNR